MQNIVALLQSIPENKNIRVFKGEKETIKTGYDVQLSDNLDFARQFYSFIKPYSSDFYKLLVENESYLCETDSPIWFTKDRIIDGKSFLEAMRVHFHETYHCVVQKTNHTNFKKLPESIRNKISELDEKNWKLIEPLVFSEATEEEIHANRGA